MTIRLFIAFVFTILNLQTASMAVAQGSTTKISRFSGKPLPRFESLRYSAVNGRQGPGFEHAIKWRYQRAGLPVLIIRETTGWRRIRDLDGEEVWMHERTLSEQRTVIIMHDVILRLAPYADAPGLARLEASVIARLEFCENDWCQVLIDRKKGWVQDSHLWGAKIMKTEP